MGDCKQFLSLILLFLSLLAYLSGVCVSVSLLLFFSLQSRLAGKAGMSIPRIVLGTFPRV